MAFTVNKVYFYKKGLEGANSKRKTQIIEIEFSRGASDVTVDLFSLTGIFWTSAKANVTNGAFATTTAANFAGIVNAIDGVHSLEIVASNGFMTRVSGAPAAATEYRLTNAGTYPAVQPVITLFSNAAPANIRIVCEFTLKPEQYGITQ